jgi:hypothetical protein
MSRKSARKSNVIKFPTKTNESSERRNIRIKQDSVRTFLRELKAEGAVAVAAVMVMPDGTMHVAGINLEREMLPHLHEAGAQLRGMVASGMHKIQHT